jgi:diguanylate cyclase (GGDEF)-like protein
MATKTSRQVDQVANQRKVIVLTLLLLTVLWSMVIVSAVSARHESVVATAALLQRMNRAVAEQTRQQFRLADAFLATCEHWLQANPSQDPLVDPAFRKLVAGFRVKTDASIDVLLVAADGHIFDVLGEGRQPLAESAAGEYLDLQGSPANDGLFIGSPIRNPLSGRPGLPVALSLANPAHDIKTLFAVLDLTKLARVYEEQRQQPGGTITLLRRDGTVLARAPDDRSVPSQSIADGRSLGAHLTQGPGGLVLLEKAANSEAREFVSFSSMSDFPLMIMVSEDHDEALASWRRQTVWMVLLALGVTIPLGVVAYRSLRLLQALGNRNAELQHLAVTDPLTGVSSRQHFLQALEEELGRARRDQLPLTILLFEIDFFQRINDGYGHAIGDKVLTSFAVAASSCLRESALLGRLGGGEFAMLLPNTMVGEATLVAEQVRSKIATISIATENGTVRFTASVGASEASAGDSSFDDLLKRATKALREASAGGHDRVAVF